MLTVEPDIGLRDVIRHQKPVPRPAFIDVRQPLLGEGRVDRAIDHDMGHMDAFRAQFPRHALGERAKPVFGARKGRITRTAPDTGRGAGEQDRATAPGRHEAGDFPAHEEARIAGHFPDLGVDAGRGIAHGKVHIGANVEHGDLDGPHILFDLGDQFDHRRFVPGVDAVGAGPKPPIADGLRQCLQLVQVTGAAGDAGLIAFNREAPRDRPTRGIAGADNKTDALWFLFLHTALPSFLQSMTRMAVKSIWRGAGGSCLPLRRGIGLCQMGHQDPPCRPKPSDGFSYRAAQVSSETTKTVAVIGGGPAGLFVAERLGALGCRVSVFDRMPTVGRKFLMAGRGGLNLTHSEALEAFLARYHEAREPLEPMIHSFPPAALTAWCEGLGQTTFTGTSGRVFPESFKASPLLRSWLQRLAGLGVVIRTRHEWRGWAPDGALRFDVLGRGETVPAPDAVVLALGGASWPRLGSNGAWREVLEPEGVAVAPFLPANCGFTCGWSPAFAERFAGTPLKTVGISFDGERRRGPITITRTGLEGGVIYPLAAALRRSILDRGGATLVLDLRPDTPRETLAARLRDVNPRHSLSNRLRKAAGLSPPAIGLLREAGGTTLDPDPERLATVIKELGVPLTGTAGLDRAISTAGGVRFDALDTHLMLNARPGVFVAGEMLDWEAPTGGYLLQACFATAARAADGVAHYLKVTSP